MTIHRPFPGSSGADGELVAVTPEDAGWEWTGLRVLRLAPGRPVTLVTGSSEVFVLPLRGSLTVAVSPEVDGEAEPGTTEAKFALNGRASVFSAVTDFAYVGRDSIMVLESDKVAEVAVPAARCSLRLEARYAPASTVPVDIRGAGPASRQVNNFGVPGVWDHAEKLICVELITPPGNWSSYPPHKHDASVPCEVVNEEIYYYRIAGADQVTPSRAGFGHHRTYTGPEHEGAGLEVIDETLEVRDHDVVLVPHGYHGPCMAAPGYPMYYLNVMAGPADERSMAFCDDPAHAWLRDSWNGQPTDPRCPVTSAEGRVDGLVPSYDDDKEEAR
ncbi:MAG: 5-deoxy-glucuronate isomerase [Marmoricola sp.]|nr:5-deoxy-glucuronate isomerase [Marmoricola sp.]